MAPVRKRKLGLFGASFSEQLLNTHTQSYFYTKFALHKYNQVRALKPQEPKQTGTGDITKKAQTEEGRAGGKGSHCRERFPSFFPDLIKLTAWNKLRCGSESLPSLMLSSQSKPFHLWLPFSGSSYCSWGTLSCHQRRKFSSRHEHRSAHSWQFSPRSLDFCKVLKTKSWLFPSCVCY